MRNTYYEIFYYTKSIQDVDSTQITITPGAYEIESLNNEFKRNIIEEGRFTEDTYPITIKPNCRTLGNIKEISSNITDSQNAFTPNDSIRDLLEYKPVIIHEEYNLSHYPVDIISFNKNFSRR